MENTLIERQTQYVIHYSNDDGELLQRTLITPYRSGVESDLFHFGQRYKVFKVERREVEIKRTVQSIEDVTLQMDRHVNMWDSCFTRIHIKDKPTLFVWSPETAIKTYTKLTEQHGKDAIKMDPLVNVYLCHSLVELSHPLTILMREDQHTTCNVIHVDEKLRSDSPIPKSAISIIVMRDEVSDNTTFLRQLDALSKEIRENSNEVCIVVFSTSLKYPEGPISEDEIWKEMQTTHTQIYCCRTSSDEEENARKIHTALNRYLSDVNVLHYLRRNTGSQ